MNAAPEKEPEMTNAQMHTILTSKIGNTESDIANKIESIRNSALRAEPSTYALQSSVAELATLRTRLETLREMAALVAPRES